MSLSGDTLANEVILNSKKICGNIKSENKRVRKQALIEFEEYLGKVVDKLTNQDLRNIFDETYMFTINALRDGSEPVREQAIKFLSYFIIEKLPLNDYYLTYIFPVLVERIGTVELIEDSEEVRLQLLEFLRAIIDKYSNTEQLKPFLNDIVTILCESVKDKYPTIKENSCICVVELAAALPRDFHLQCESLVKPVLTVFGHQRFKIRVAAVQCIGVIIMHSTYKALEEAVGPLAERLFDQIALVRRTVAQVAARLLLEYRDRYSFFHKLLPLLLTGLNDEVPETREEAHKLWAAVGLQYQQENEKDFKDQLDFLIQPPKYYPKHLIRPNLGCRVLVQRNVGKMAPALANELESWQADIQVRCSQLLCSIALCAESGLTQHLQELLSAMYWSARNKDKRVVGNILTAGEYIGLFVPAKTWCKLILPAIENGAHYGHVSVLASFIRGAPEEYVKDYLREISELLATDNICRSRKMKYQRELVKCIEAITAKLDLEDESCKKIGECLFTIIVTLISIQDVENVELITNALLDTLAETLRLNSAYELWSLYLRNLLEIIKNDPESWTVVTMERCIFETILLESGQAFGENLDIIGEILVKTLDTDVDAEARLRIFVALSAALENKDVIFSAATDLNKFLETLISDVLVPSLVWHAGRTAEAMRTVAASCLKSALVPNNVDLFETGEVLRLLFDRLLPLLLSLMEDASYRSRQLAIENVVLLKQTASRKNIWALDDLLKVYQEVLKRLDDPTDKVRICATKSLGIILQSPPEEFIKPNFVSHHDLLIDSLLTHFDDDEEQYQALVMDVLIVIGQINKGRLKEKLVKMKPLIRNKVGCDLLLENLEKMKISE